MNRVKFLHSPYISYAFNFHTFFHTSSHTNNNHEQSLGQKMYMYAQLMYGAARHFHRERYKRLVIAFLQHSRKQKVVHDTRT